MAQGNQPDDSVLVQNARFAVAAELEKKRVLKQPIARFDKKTGNVYMEHSDGTREPMGEIEKKRYSERKR